MEDNNLLEDLTGEPKLPFEVKDDEVWLHFVVEGRDGAYLGKIENPGDNFDPEQLKGYCDSPIRFSRLTRIKEISAQTPTGLAVVSVFQGILPGSDPFEDRTDYISVHTVSMWSQVPIDTVRESLLEREAAKEKQARHQKEFEEKREAYERQARGAVAGLSLPGGGPLGLPPGLPGGMRF